MQKGPQSFLGGGGSWQDSSQDKEQVLHFTRVQGSLEATASKPITMNDKLKLSCSKSHVYANLYCIHFLFSLYLYGVWILQNLHKQRSSDQEAPRQNSAENPGLAAGACYSLARRRLTV